MMGQRTFHGVNRAMFGSAFDAEDTGDMQLEFMDEADAPDESVQRKRRHRVGSKPPWLRDATQEESPLDRRMRRNN